MQITVDNVKESYRCLHINFKYTSVYTPVSGTPQSKSLYFYVPNDLESLNDIIHGFQDAAEEIRKIRDLESCIPITITTKEKNGS